MIRGAIFDADGTLLDSTDFWRGVGESYLRSVGCVPEEDLDEALKPLTLEQAADYCRTRYGIQRTAEEIMDGMRGIIERFYRTEVRPKPGVQEFLQKLRARGVGICVATLTDRPLIETALDHCGIRAYISAVFDCADAGRGKEDPAVYRAALRHLGTRREDTVVFEDALYAVRTAKRDGFRVAAVYDRHESGQAEIRDLADLYLTDFQDTGAFWRFASTLG